MCWLSKVQVSFRSVDHAKQPAIQIALNLIACDWYDVFNECISIHKARKHGTRHSLTKYQSSPKSKIQRQPLYHEAQKSRFSDIDSNLQAAQSYIMHCKHRPLKHFREIFMLDMVRMERYSLSENINEHM